MNLLILYESCTGNTELGVEVIRRTLEEDGHACTVRRFRDADAGELEGYSLYGFATPVQSFAPLTPVHRFLKEMPKLQGRPAFIFTTCSGWPGAAHRMMASQLRHKGMAVLGAHTMGSQQNWPIGRKYLRHLYDFFAPPRKKSLKKTQAFARDMASRAYRYYDGIEDRQAPHILWPTPTLLPAFFAVRGMLAHGYGKRTVDAELCTRCGICVETCPVGAVRQGDLPVFDDTCIGCWACFNNCPTHAIISSLCKPEHYYSGIGNREKVLRKVGLK